MTVPPRNEFSVIDLDSDLDGQTYRQACPTDITCKGMYFTPIQKLITDAGKELSYPRKYLGFGDYPYTEIIDLMLETASKVYPDQPLRRALYEMGRTAYPVFADSMIGKVTFGVLGDNLPRVIKIASKAYDVSISRGTGETLEVGEDYAVVHFRDIYGFVNTYQPGVFQGALDLFGYVGEISLKEISISEAYMHLRWTKKS